MFKPTKLMDFMVTFIFSTLVTTMILCILVLIFEEINTNSIASVFELCGPYYQVIFKLVATRLSMTSISNLLHKIKNGFWDINKFGPEFQGELSKIINFTDRFYRLFRYCCYLTGIFICLRPIVFSKTFDYPLKIYNILDEKDLKSYLLLYSLQASNFAFGINILLAVDGIFILFILNIYIQLKMLKYGFSSLKFNEIKNEADEKICYLKIIEYIKHHNRILQFIKEFSNVFSLQIFNQFIGNCISLCMGIYMGSGSITELSIAIKAMTIVIVFALELLVFCISGTLITEIGLEIHKSAFYSGWEKIYNKRIRYAIGMIIVRSQKPEILKAVNMFKLNLNSFLKILKTSVSVYTLMNNINK